MQGFLKIIANPFFVLKAIFYAFSTINFILALKFVFKFDLLAVNSFGFGILIFLIHIFSLLTQMRFLSHVPGLFSKSIDLIERRNQLKAEIKKNLMAKIKKIPAQKIEDYEFQVFLSNNLMALWLLDGNFDESHLRFSNRYHFKVLYSLGSFNVQIQNVPNYRPYQIKVIHQKNDLKSLEDIL